MTLGSHMRSRDGTRTVIVGAFYSGSKYPDDGPHCLDPWTRFRDVGSAGPMEQMCHIAFCEEFPDEVFTPHCEPDPGNTIVRQDYVDFVHDRSRCRDCAR